MDFVKRLEDEYLPKLRSLESQLRERHPDVQFAVGSSPTGNLTSLQGHSVYIEGIFPRDETLQQLGLTFPRLAEAFARAVSRGRPRS